MKAIDFFSPDYTTARGRFLDAVSKLGWQTESYPLQAKGPNDEQLCVDVASIGAPESERVVIVSSGLHGVEGFFGSAVQLAWLEGLTAEWLPPANTKVVLVHALNPFGFAWLRRWNENNVDLNRNFLGDLSFLTEQSYQESRAVSERLYPFLNSSSPPSRWEPYTLKALWWILAEGFAARRQLELKQRPYILSLNAIKRLGMEELQKTLPVGQYEHRKGLFYGGKEPEETTLMLQEKLPAWTKGVALTLHIDFHTGLGKWKDYKLLINDLKGSESAEWVAANFGENAVEASEGKTAYKAHGTMAEYFRDRRTGGTYHCLTAEFGTYSGIRVLGALRTENRAHFYAKRGSNRYKWAKRKIVKAFCPASPCWRKAVVPKGIRIINRAIKVCSNSKDYAVQSSA